MFLGLNIVQVQRSGFVLKMSTTQQQKALSNMSEPKLNWPKPKTGEAQTLGMSKRHRFIWRFSRALWCFVSGKAPLSGLTQKTLFASHHHFLLFWLISDQIEILSMVSLLGSIRANPSSLTFFSPHKRQVLFYQPAISVSRCGSFPFQRLFRACLNSGEFHGTLFLLGCWDVWACPFSV